MQLFARKYEIIGDRPRFILKAGYGEANKTKTAQHPSGRSAARMNGAGSGLETEGTGVELFLESGVAGRKLTPVSYDDRYDR